MSILTMNESAKTVAIAFAEKNWERRRIVYNRENILDVMPIGTPLTCTEICAKVADLGVANVGGWAPLMVTVQQVVQCMKSLIPFGIVERKEVAVEPYTVMVREAWGGNPPRYKIVDKKIVYVRLK